MVLEFKLPDLGEGVAEGEIVKWLVTQGQQVKEDEPMVEVMTDKATVQIPSPATGIVKQILAKEGQTVKVGTNLVMIESTAEKEGSPESLQTLQKVSSARKEEEKIAPQGGTSSLQPLQTPPEPQRIIATPSTRKLARDLGIDLEKLTGTGPGGRITEEDVRKGAAGPKEAQRPRQEAILQQVGRPVEELKKIGVSRPVQLPGMEERVPIHGIRKRISEKMLKSAQTTASVTHMDEVDFTELVALREATKPLAESQNVKITYMPFIIKAVTTALKQFPFFNASIDDQSQEFIVKHYYNIGFATDTSNGLIVPVVKEADRKNILEIAKEIERLSEDARSGKIQLQDLQGGTFTITNIGTLGGVMSTPIINLPEVAILGVHKIQKKPVVLSNEIVIRDVVNIALTFDHRIVDGADAARFAAKLKQYLENPSLIFVESSLNTSQS